MTKAKASFNLSALDTISACNKPVEIEIKDISGAPTGVFFSVLGKDSDVYRGRVRALADEALRRQASGKPAVEKIDELERKNIDALVAATVGWRTGVLPTLAWGDEQLEFSPDNARKVYAALLPVREQISEAINSVENFMRA